MQTRNLIAHAKAIINWGFRFCTQSCAIAEVAFIEKFLQHYSSFM